MGRFIGDALNSVSRQTYDNWEVIVVDDCGPEDGTRKVVELFAESCSHHRVELIRHNENRGVSAARNSAIDVAKGDLMALLDPDDLWKPEHLTRTIDLFEKNPEVGIVAGSVEAFNDDDTNNVLPYPIKEWQITNFPASLVCNNFIQPSAVIVRRKVIIEAGYFTTDVHLQHIEDYDLWIRLAKLGVKFAFRDGATCLYRKHANAATSDLQKMCQLHDALIHKHLTFFVQMQGRMQKNIFNRSADISDSLTGPLWARFMSLNRWLRRLRSSLSSKNSDT